MSYGTWLQYLITKCQIPRKWSTKSFFNSKITMCNNIMCRFRRVTFIISFILYLFFLVNNFLPSYSTITRSMTNFSTSITLFLSLIKSPNPLPLCCPLCPLPRPLLLFSSFANSSFDLCPCYARHKVSSLELDSFRNAFSLSLWNFLNNFSKVIAFIRILTWSDSK